MVTLELTDEQAETLQDLLDEVLGDLSSEIAATDHPGYRATLNTRRDRLGQVREGLGG